MGNKPLLHYLELTASSGKIRRILIGIWEGFIITNGDSIYPCEQVEESVYRHSWRVRPQRRWLFFTEVWRFPPLNAELGYRILVFEDFTSAAACLKMYQRQIHVVQDPDEILRWEYLLGLDRLR